MTSDDPTRSRSRAVERVGQSLELEGIPRMPARAFAFVLTDPSETRTARDLAEGLEASPAAVSGAVRYLVDNRLLVKERTPGSRAERYRLADGDLWATIIRARLPLMEHMIAGIDEAIGYLGAHPTGEVGTARLRETREFFAFMQQDLAEMLERWAASRGVPR
ncbi:helix-turn-helix domain-containing protein [Nocardioides sp.]|uniref:GbsR/MarR family transcriptional regulator n=1 Tax=Nocardioides sp. TaxID=35761 RepID=UPI002B26D5FE|nr:helix-turn-helix domain-containing protein [Nocardioides sp.]